MEEKYFFIMLDMRRYKNSERGVKFKKCFMVTTKPNNLIIYYQI